MGVKFYSFIGCLSNTNLGAHDFTNKLSEIIIKQKINLNFLFFKN